MYSCFNERLGLYEYFQDDRGHALNGDLPVPSYLGGKKAGKIGVPAREAGRPLPSGTKRIGHGFEAKGMVVSCKPTPMKGLAGGTDATNLGLRLGTLSVMAVMALYGTYCAYQEYV